MTKGASCIHLDNLIISIVVFFFLTNFISSMTNISNTSSTLGVDRALSPPLFLFVDL